MSDPNWFQKKWGKLNEVPMDDVYNRLVELEDRIKVLEEENVETSNLLYEIMNSMEAIDRRIDIVFEEFNK